MNVADAVRASDRHLKLIIDTIPELACKARSKGSADFFNDDPTEKALNGE